MSQDAPPADPQKLQRRIDELEHALRQAYSTATLIDYALDDPDKTEAYTLTRGLRNFIHPFLR